MEWIIYLFEVWKEARAVQADIPMQVSWIFFALAALATGVQVYSQQQQAEAQKEQVEENIRYNREVAKNKADQEQIEQHARETKQIQEQRRRRASLIGAIAKSGVSAGVGTPSAYLQEQAAIDTLNLRQTKRDSLNRIKYIEASANMSEWQGENLMDYYDYKSDSAMISGVGNLISSSASIYSKKPKRNPEIGDTR